MGPIQAPYDWPNLLISMDISGTPLALVRAMLCRKSAIFQLTPFLLTILVSMNSFLASAGAAALRPKETYNHPICDLFLNPNKVILIPDADGKPIPAVPVPQLSVSAFAYGYSLFLVNGAVEFETGDYDIVKMATERHTSAMKRRGFYIRKDNYRLHGPGTVRLNQILDSFAGSVDEKIFRFADWFAAWNRGEGWDEKSFLEAIVKNQIYLATRGRYFFHDRSAAHMVAMLFMPNSSFRLYSARARFLLSVGKELESSRQLSKGMRKMYFILAWLWDTVTEEVGGTLMYSSDSEGFLGYQALGTAPLAMLKNDQLGQMQKSLTSPELHADALIAQLSYYGALSGQQQDKIRQLAKAAFADTTFPTESMIKEQVRQQMLPR